MESGLDIVSDRGILKRENSKVLGCKSVGSSDLLYKNSL